MLGARIGARRVVRGECELMGDGTIMHQCDINVALAGELRRKKSLTTAYPMFNIRPSYGIKSPFKVNNLHVPCPNQHVPDRQPMG
jgi:hypothetical protein